MQIGILNNSNFEIWEEGIRTTIEKTFAEHGISGEHEVSVAVVGEEEMKQLHQKYMETYETTDVLSFPFQKGEEEYAADSDGMVRWGDIVVCYPVAVAQAKAGGKEANAEINFLVEHSCLHLLGIHHE